MNPALGKWSLSYGRFQLPEQPEASLSYMRLCLFPQGALQNHTPGLAFLSQAGWAGPGGALCPLPLPSSLPAPSGSNLDWVRASGSLKHTAAESDPLAAQVPPLPSHLLICQELK